MAMSLASAITYFNTLSGTYLRLFLSAPDNTGAGGTEVSASDYVGKLFTFDTPTTQTLTNNADITFVESAGTSWGQITHWKLMTSASGAGTVRDYGKFRTPIVVQIGSRVKVPAGALVITNVGLT